MKSLLPSDPVRRGRVILALLAAVCVLPVAAATLIWWLDLAPGTAGNYGTLLAPAPVRLPAQETLKGKWVLVQFDGGACDARCERKLYVMRQLRRAQGREMGRVERLWLATDAAAPRAELLAAIEGTALARADAALVERFAAAVGPGGDITEHVFLVDPLGNLMLRFPRDPDPTQMIKDLKRLLRVSGFG